MIYELRFRRKEIHKLYGNQKVLVKTINELKNENLHIQSNYIDLVSSLRDIPPEKVR